MWYLTLALLIGNAQTKPTITKNLHFLRGCWENHTATEVVTETWSIGPDWGDGKTGSYRGHSETSQKGRVLFWENISIYQDKGVWTYRPAPMGKSSVAFTLEDCSTADQLCANFVNRTHDFPREIKYSQSRKNDRLLEVELNGEQKKKPKKVNYTLKLRPC